MSKQKPNQVVANTKITSIGVWSLAYTTFVYSFVLALIGNVVLFAVWKVAESANVIGKIDEQIVGIAGASAFQLSDYVTQGRVMGISLVASVAFIAAAPLLSLILGGLYGAIATWTGGVRLTFTSILPEAADAVEAAVTDAQAAETETPIDNTVTAPIPAVAPVDPVTDPVIADQFKNLDLEGFTPSETIQASLDATKAGGKRRLIPEGETSIPEVEITNEIPRIPKNYDDVPEI